MIELDKKIKKSQYEILKNLIELNNAQVTTLSNNFSHDFNNLKDDFGKIEKKIEEMPLLISKIVRNEISEIQQKDRQKISDLEYKLISCQSDIKLLKDKIILVNKDYRRTPPENDFENRYRV
jgi:hypothetical protein